jgi:hypothetical protein
MRKLPYTIIFACLLMTTACKKSSTSNWPTVNYWSFWGNTYAVTASSRSLVQPELSLTGDTAGVTGFMNLYFYTSYPTGSGTYRIVTGTVPMASDEIAVQFVTAAVDYRAVSTDHLSATVIVSSTGRVAVTIPPIHMVNNFLASDTALILSGTVHE